MRSSIASLLLLFGSSNCFNLLSNVSAENPDKLEQHQAAEYAETLNKTIYEERLEEFKTTLMRYNFTNEDLKAIFGEEKAIVGDQLMIHLTYRLGTIIALTEIRRLFGLKQQPIAYDRLVDEEPIDSTKNIDPKSIRLFQLSVIRYNRNSSFYLIPVTERYMPLTDEHFARAAFILKKFPEIRQLLAMKFEEIGIEKFVLDKVTIEKTFHKLPEAMRAADLVLIQALDHLTTDSYKAFLEKNESVMKLYKEVDEEYKILIKENF